MNKLKPLFGNPIISAANTCAILGLFVILFFFFSSDGIEIVSVVIAPIVFWVVGAFVSAFFLMFLTPIFVRVKPRSSLLLFLLVGFGFPFSTGYFMSSIGAHGNPSSLESNYFAAITLVFTSSVIGCCASYSSWKSLHAWVGKDT